MRATDIHTRTEFQNGPLATSATRASEIQGTRTAPTGGPGMSVRLDPGPTAAAEARAALALLDGRIDRDALDDIRLLVSELVTNCVRHSHMGGQPVDLTVTSAGDTVRVEVTDGGAGFEPRPRTKASDEAGGWGLHLVDRIAARWGVDTGRGTRVWFELDS